MGSAGADHLPGKEFYIVDTRLKDGVAGEEMMKVLPDHLDYQIELEKNGTLFAAGSSEGGPIIAWRIDPRSGELLTPIYYDCGPVSWVLTLRQE